jgi:hypothetical protein
LPSFFRESNQKRLNPGAQVSENRAGTGIKGFFCFVCGAHFCFFIVSAVEASFWHSVLPPADVAVMDACTSVDIESSVLGTFLLQCTLVSVKSSCMPFIDYHVEVAGAEEAEMYLSLFFLL